MFYTAGRKIRNLYLNDKCRTSSSRIQVGLCQAGVGARIELCGLRDGQRLIGGLDEPRLGLEVDQLSVLQPLDLQLEVGVVDGVAAERGRVGRLHLVVLRPGSDSEKYKTFLISTPG
jgi:hypothetical protein